MMSLMCNVKAQSPKTRVAVTVENIKITEKGTIFIGLYNKDASFPISGKELKGKRVKINGKSSLTVYFDNLPVGTYAIAIFHDTNNNKKLDKNWFGIPTEGYGFSKNVFGTFGPPSFQEASFKVKANSTTRLKIKLEY